MILLDTDHVSVMLMANGIRFQHLIVALTKTTERISTSIVTIEETMRGWLAAIAKEKKPDRQVFAYKELQALFAQFAKFHIAPFDDTAATHFIQLRKLHRRVGTQDLKIASIALAQNALLLTANKRDFEQIPGLRFENWMDPPAAS